MAETRSRFADNDTKAKPKAPVEDWRVEIQWYETRNEHRYEFCDQRSFPTKVEAEVWRRELEDRPLPIGAFDARIVGPTLLPPVRSA